MRAGEAGHLAVAHSPRLSAQIHHPHSPLRVRAAAGCMTVPLRTLLWRSPENWGTRSCRACMLSPVVLDSVSPLTQRMERCPWGRYMVGAHPWLIGPNAAFSGLQPSIACFHAASDEFASAAAGRASERVAAPALWASHHSLLLAWPPAAPTAARPPYVYTPACNWVSIPRWCSPATLALPPTARPLPLPPKRASPTRPTSHPARTAQQSV